MVLILFTKPSQGPLLQGKVSAAGMAGSILFETFRKRLQGRQIALRDRVYVRCEGRRSPRTDHLDEGLDQRIGGCGED